MRDPAKASGCIDAPCRILLIEDNPDDAYLIEIALTQAVGRWSLQHCVRISDAIAHLRKNRTFDAVLLDMSLPDSTGPETIAAIVAEAPELPIVVLTGFDDEASAAQAIQVGAQDYLVKGQIETSVLVRAIRHAIERHSLLQSLRIASLEDPLTDLYNRRGFLLLAEQQLKSARRNRRSMVLLFLDVDCMKDINDSFGHAEGDGALAAVGRVMQATFRDGDVLARIGGDEFVALAIETEDIDRLKARLKAAIEADRATKPRPYDVSFSIGAVRIDPSCTKSMEDLLADADADMYEDKRRRSSQPASVRAGATRPIEILLVEDNAADAELTRDAFAESALRSHIVVVQDGAEALKRLRRQPPLNDATTPDIILLDINLPKKSGTEVLAEIKADGELAKIPVIMLTSSDADRDIVASYRLKANSYMRKPSSLDQFAELVQTIERVWRAHQE